MGVKMSTKEMSNQLDKTIFVEMATQSDAIWIIGQSNQSDESMNDINEKN